MKFDRLISRARELVPSIDSRSRCKHISFLLQGNKIISEGINQCMKTHPISKKHETKFHTLHSEMHAILKCKKKYNFKKLTLINFRFKKDKTLGLSKPCKACQKIIKDIQIKNIYYSTNENIFEKMK